MQSYIHMHAYTQKHAGLTDSNYRDTARVGVKRVKLDGSDAVPGGSFKPLTYRQFMRVFHRMRAEADVALQAQMALRGWVEPDRIAAQRVLMDDGSIVSIEEARKTGCLASGGGEVSGACKPEPAPAGTGAEQGGEGAGGVGGRLNALEPAPPLSSPPTVAVPPAVSSCGMGGEECQQDLSPVAVMQDVGVEGVGSRRVAGGGGEGEGEVGDEARVSDSNGCAQGEEIGRAVIAGKEKQGIEARLMSSSEEAGRGDAGVEEVVSGGEEIDEAEHGGARQAGAEQTIAVGVSQGHGEQRGAQETSVHRIMLHEHGNFPVESGDMRVICACVTT